MRRFSSFGAVVVVAIIATAIPAGATSRPPPVTTPEPVTEPVTGTLTSVRDVRFAIITDPSCPNGDLLDMTVGGAIAPFGAAEIAIHMCDRWRVNEPLESSFTLTSAEGTLSGAVASWGRGPYQPPVVVPFDLELSIASGTGRFTNPSGTIVLDGALQVEPLPPISGTVSGSVTFTEPLEPPEPPANCHRHHDGQHDRHHRHRGHLRDHDHGRGNWGHDSHPPGPPDRRCEPARSGWPQRSISAQQ